MADRNSTNEQHQQSLRPGQELAHYTIKEMIGRGGMGEVYRALDNKLQRDVALKVLSPALVGSPNQLARFRREARLLAQLEHPNIGGIHGFEEEQGVCALALELIEGESLSERIKREPLTFGRALQVACEIARGLEAAHEKGIIHRDLKPSNVRITPRSEVKVLDFGLGKSLSAQQTVSGPETLATETGMIMGTIPYMSPEQVRGQAVDERTDIWAFGCVFFEMLTGESPFFRPNSSDTLSAILQAEPDWARLPKLPGGVLRILKRCLRKDADRRFRHIADVRIEIEELQSDPSEDSEGGDTVTVPRPLWQSLLPWAVSSLLAVALVSQGLWKGPPEVPRQVVRLSVPPPEGGRPSNVQFALSPDGRYLAFIVIDEMGRRLAVRPFDSMEAKILHGPETSMSLPFWSPDSRFVGFATNQSLKKVDILGRPAQTVVQQAGIGASTWSPEGKILFEEDGAIKAVSANGGSVETVISIEGTQVYANRGQPHFLPDGEHFLFLGNDQETSAVFVGSLDGEPPHLILRADSKAEYAAGYLFFARGSTLMAQGFDPATLETTGDPFPALSSPLRMSMGRAGFSVSQSGSLAYNTGEFSADYNAYWVNRTGNETLLFGPDRYSDASLSPDGSQVAVSVLRPNEVPTLWLFDTITGTPQRLPFEQSGNSPVWSADGSTIAFESGGDIFTIPSDGSENASLLWANDLPKTPRSWSANGELAFEQGGGFGSKDIWVYKDGTANSLVTTPVNDTRPSFSPDGKWIAYFSEGAVYAQAYPGLAGPVQILPTGGGFVYSLLWAPTGQELFAVTENALTIAQLSLEGRRIAVESTRPILPDTVRLAGIHPTDGRLLVFRRVDELEQEIRVVLNWTEELKQHAPETR